MVLLLIMDGWGHNSDPKRSAIAAANTPFIDELYHKYPNAELLTHGEYVGLPEGQMGNSEVGHINIGAGRIVYQELARINKVIKENTLKDNQVLQDLITKAKSEHKTVHIMGLLSDGGVHSHINHMKAICQIFDDNGLQDVFIHAFLDGRDTAPTGGKKYIKELVDFNADKSPKLASIIGRYYAMDRDNRWERTQEAYNLLVNQNAKISTDDPINAVQKEYDNGVTDEFMSSILVETDKDKEHQKIKDGDIVININFRTDRPRQITQVLTQSDMPEYNMHKLDITYATMTMYDESFDGIDVLFTKENLKETLGEVLEREGKTQLRIAETEKYPHVTFFFSGGREVPFEGESRIMVKSPSVATYDLAPEMSAQEITDKLLAHIEVESPDFICLNFANTDMVGHTGDFDAAKVAAQTVDGCVQQIANTILPEGYKIVIIADHGNSDYMVNDDGSPHTAHTTFPVPVILLGKDINKENTSINDGVLADVTPTILELLGIKQPKSMTGQSIIQ